MSDIRRRLEDEGQRRGEYFIVGQAGVVLDPRHCCWKGLPDVEPHCEHVDHNVGMMVRCLVYNDDGKASHCLSVIHGRVSIVCAYSGAPVERAHGETTAEALARLLLKLWGDGDEAATVDA
jgi:hypothetical protein